MTLDSWLWLLPALPLLGFVVLALIGRSLPERLIGAIGTGTVALAFVAALVMALAGQGSQRLWTWFSVEGFLASVGLTLDPLSACFVLVITGVGALIHLFATDYMRGDPGYARFFAYMNLFVAFMLTLVLADDLLLLYLGWEGVGLCSYLLIGFWYEDPDNGRAARKAFVVTRVGDAALMVALLLLATQTGTLRLPEVLHAAAASFAPGGPVAQAAALLLLAGAVGKSAQVPLQVWLPDAMAGPTPVSALIHAATMVTAGVYLVARTHPLFELAPAAMDTVALVGTVTLLLGGVSAMFQRDIKRVLAYSTMSQIGYLFLALGVGAYSAAIFHFVTHALFKALLFIGAGAVILAMDHDQDMFAMGGLRKKLPLTFWTFLVGCLALSGVPLVTGGFFSKEAILTGAAASDMALWVGGVVGALLTSLYTFRMLILVFLRPREREVHRYPGLATRLAMVALAALAVLTAGLGLPVLTGGISPVTTLLEPVLADAPHAHEAPVGEGTLMLLVSIVSLLGIALAFWMYARPPQALVALREGRAGRALSQLAAEGMGFDRLYDSLLVRPLWWAGRANRGDLLDALYEGLARLAAGLHRGLARTQTGLLRAYLMVMIAGAALLVGLALWR